MEDPKVLDSIIYAVDHIKDYLFFEKVIDANSTGG